ncbi:hypothetical protein F2P81_018695 [Scophthalmus maximus]|uniref:Uncharacterized protein n=1 Tax=Scophthalmus maximus TaxID=52904 RepID=A0A6A4SCT9_SCOMX|nr:hypothetical protein F2P81_018695 [Scophthalmus maximus]
MSESAEPATGVTGKASLTQQCRSPWLRTHQQSLQYNVPLSFPETRLVRLTLLFSKSMLNICPDLSGSLYEFNSAELFFREALQTSKRKASRRWNANLADSKFVSSVCAHAAPVGVNTLTSSAVRTPSTSRLRILRNPKRGVRYAARRRDGPACGKDVIL